MKRGGGRGKESFLIVLVLITVLVITLNFLFLPIIISLQCPAFLHFVPCCPAMSCIVLHLYFKNLVVTMIIPFTKTIWQFVFIRVVHPLISTWSILFSLTLFGWGRYIYLPPAWIGLSESLHVISPQAIHELSSWEVLNLVAPGFRLKFEKQNGRQKSTVRSCTLTLFGWRR